VGAEKKWRSVSPEWTPDEVNFVIVDSFETPVRRPSVNDMRKSHCLNPPRRRKFSAIRLIKAASILKC
jgi:hypothetical protein